MSSKSKRRKRIRRGLKRALVTFIIAGVGLFVLNYGWDYVLGNQALAFTNKSARLIINGILLLLMPVAAYASAFKASKGKDSSGT